MARGFVPVTMGSSGFRSRDVDGFRVVHALFPLGLVLPPHSHERPGAAVTLSGSWDSCERGRARACERASFLVEPAGERHANRFEHRTSVVILQPDPEREELWRPCARLLADAGHFRDGTVLGLAGRIASELLLDDAVSALALEGLALELLAAAHRRSPLGTRMDPPPWVARAKDMVDAQYRDRLRVVVIAAEVGVHPVHLTRVFHACYGATIGAYVRALRVDWAVREVRESGRPLAEIALEAGFADQSHFTRAFRKRTGLTPARFRLLAGKA